MSNVVDAITGAIYFFVFALALLISVFILNQVAAGGLFSAIPTLPAHAADFFASLNNVSIFILLGLSLGAILSALLIPSHPAFFFISILLVFIEFMIIPPLVNVYNGILLSPSFIGEASQFNLTIGLLQQLPIWTAATTLLAAIVAIMARGQFG